jgi:hypothetical protein
MLRLLLAIDKVWAAAAAAAAIAKSCAAWEVLNAEQETKGMVFSNN